MDVEIVTPDADPDRGGFGTRVHALVSAFARFANVRVVLTDGSTGTKVPGVRYDAFPLRDTVRTKVGRMMTFYRRDFPRVPTGDPPDFVVVESLDLLGLHQYGPHVPLLLDEHNVYWNLLRYEIVNLPAFRGPIGRTPIVRRLLIPGLLERAKRFEMRSIRNAFRTIVTSEVDREAILAECPEVAARLRVVPNCVDAQRIPVPPEGADSKTVLFVGSFNYIPNREAAEFIAGTLAPALPRARMLLVGANPPTEVIRGPNVEAAGHVPDLNPVLRDAAVCIAPLAHGSGTRIKILTYLAAGKAVVATTKACEGLAVRDGHDLLVRDGRTDFVAAVAELLEDRDARRRLGSNGRSLVESTYDWRVQVERLKDIASEVCAGIGGGVGTFGTALTSLT